MKSGKYYAAIVIPEDFSESLTSVLTGTIEQPKFTYYLNEKKMRSHRNYGQWGDSGAESGQ